MTIRRLSTLVLTSAAALLILAGGLPAPVGAGAPDADGDGFTTPDDCDDGDPLVFPGAAELCNGVDDDCDGTVPSSETDTDGDAVRACDGDCNDLDASVFPGATELCNGVDDDCDTTVDEGFDLDADGFSTCGGDCDDGNPLVFPGAVELCNGVDDDCDTVVPSNEADIDGDAVLECDGDCNDADASVFPGAAELCNFVDDNCDTIVDEGFDLDADGFSICGGDCDDADPLVFPGAVELCNGVDDDCDSTVDGGGVCAVPPLNHFQCYDVRRKAFDRVTVNLEDDFGTNAATVRRAKTLCAPVSKNDEDPDAPDDVDHLVGYEIRHDERFAGVLDEVVQDQFGSLVLDIRRPERILVPSAKQADPNDVVTPLDPPVVDHYQCYSVRGDRRRVSGISVEDQFGTGTTDVKKPIRLCLPVDKNGEGIVDGATRLMCYAIKPGPRVNQRVLIDNQFGPGSLDVRRARELCVPLETPGLHSHARAELSAAGVDKYLGQFAPVASTDVGDGWTKHTFDADGGAGPICIAGTDFSAFTRAGDPAKLLIFHQGGGACWQDFYNCNVLAEAQEPPTPRVGIWDFDSPDNPFADYSILYMPYCDGSVFSGDNDVSDPAFGAAIGVPTAVVRYHRGLRNQTAGMDLAKATFPDAERITVAGSEAGGDGAARFAPFLVRFLYGNSTELTVLNDAGTFLTAVNLDETDDVQARAADWQFGQFHPASCTECDDMGHGTAVIQWRLDNDSTIREALYMTDGDLTNRFFLELLADQPGFRDLIVTEHGLLNTAHPDRYKRFIVAGDTSHTAVQSPLFYSQQADGVPLNEWATDFLLQPPFWMDIVEDAVP